jgi:hypothetical protein
MIKPTKSTKYVWTTKIVLLESKLQTKYNKFQHFIAKLFKLVLADTYYHVFRINYKGNARIKKDMLVMNEQGYLFKVADVRNRTMILVTIQPLLQRPKMNGKIVIINSIDDKETDNN